MASSSSADPTQASPVAGVGPMSGLWGVPERPKPGRKPAQDEPASKRKAQNRESQRAFRERKANKYRTIQQQLIKAEENLADATVAADSLHSQLKLMNKRNDELKNQQYRDQSMIQQLQQRLSQLESIIQGSQANGQYNIPPLNLQVSTGLQSLLHSTQVNAPAGLHCGVCYGVRNNCQCAPAGPVGFSPMNQMFPQHPQPSPPQTQSLGQQERQKEREKEQQNHLHQQHDHNQLEEIKEPSPSVSDREVDVTLIWLKSRSEGRTNSKNNKNNENKTQDPNPSSEFPTETGPCGFCDSANFCPCRDLQSSNTHAEQETPNPSTATPAKAPGSCPDCQTNPAQKLWCQRVAQLRTSDNNLAPARSSRSSSISSTLEPMEPHIPDASSILPNKSSIGCSEAFKLFEGRYPMAQNRMDWIANLKPITYDEQKLEPLRRYSALELDTAGVIATLGNTLQPLQPRPADGDNVDLVHMARNYQRNTQTPGTDFSTHNSGSMSPTLDHDAMDISSDWGK